WAIRSRLEPVKKVAKMIKNHLTGILNYFDHRLTSAGAEGINSRIQAVKVAARGFRTKEGFKTAIYFHLGRLDLYPAAS
ncbi:MAG: transposase, partial [Firmicutes bacterium]|nr:transposase [Bacillota bacterium]